MIEQPAPQDPKDDSRPVVLQEPQRDTAPGDWREDAPPNPEVPHLHPGWAAILAAGETPVWHGRATPDPRLRLAGNPIVLTAMAGIFVIIALKMGFGSGGVPTLALFIFVYMVLRNRVRQRQDRQERIYLLSDRAAYLARDRAGRLADVVAYPITPILRIGLGLRSVSFATRRNDKGEEEAEGFLDIPDAADVYVLIRDLQKAQV